MRRRRRLGAILFAAASVVALAVGLTRETNEGTVDPEPIIGVGGDLRGEDAILQRVDETIDVAGGDCRQVVNDETPLCEDYAVLDLSLAWAVEQEGNDPPVASFLRRDSETQWTRLLEADGGGERGFDVANVRLDDLTGDGAVEAIFGFHRGNALAVDVVDPFGVVILHLDLGEGHVLVGGGRLITFRRDGDAWLREEIAMVDGRLEVEHSEVVEGPAEGNL